MIFIKFSVFFMGLELLLVWDLKVIEINTKYESNIWNDVYIVGIGIYLRLD